MQTKLDILSQRAEYGATSDGPTRARIEAELRSTEKGVQFCGELSEAIQRMHADFFGEDGSRAESADPLASSEALFGEGLSGCLHHMRFTLAQLEKNRQRLHQNMTTNSRSPISAEDEAASERLKTEARTLQNCLDFCSNVEEVLESHISNIENHADGDDIIQYMVSTDGKPLLGKNKGTGNRLKQAGGHLSDVSFQQMSIDFKEISIYDKHRLKQQQPVPSTPGSATVVDGPPARDASFDKRHGSGFSLSKRV